MEDDDLFWRCHFEGMTTGRVIETEENKLVANFDGNDSAIYIFVQSSVRIWCIGEV